MSIANSRDQAIDRARGTIGRPATSTRSLLQVSSFVQRKAVFRADVC
jgi:hypothetical protein